MPGCRRAIRPRAPASRRSSRARIFWSRSASSPHADGEGHDLRVVLAVMLLTAAPCFADEDPVPGILQKFGLLGTWAIDCAQPASAGNEYSVYAVSSSGEATLVYE